MSRSNKQPVRVWKIETWLSAQGAWQRVLAFLLMLAIAWLPLAGPVYWLGYRFDRSGSAEIVALVLLYGGFLWVLPSWGDRIHGWKKPFEHCGLIWQKQTGRDLAIALAIGVGGVFSLFGLETLLGWAAPVAPSARLVQFVLEGLLMALAVGFAEEMLFRGWVLAELEKNYSSTASLLLNAFFFAGTHFIKPWSEIIRTFPQFLGLVVLGMALVWARRTPTGSSKLSRMSRLGLPIGFHAGLIWGYYIVNVGGLSEYTGRAPEWVTGIDQNPLAGLLGLILLELIGWQFFKATISKTTQHYNSAQT